jgi:hypothetical protein
MQGHKIGARKITTARQKKRADLVRAAMKRPGVTEAMRIYHRCEAALENFPSGEGQEADIVITPASDSSVPKT